MGDKKSERTLELLAPARDSEIAIEAIKHGADAVYMGPPNHGARKAASNSIEDIQRVVEFAHIFQAKVYCTVNTIVYDKEIREVEKMISDLWRIGVDALIVQDMGILRMEIPPICLHASTQCDIRTPEKALFLEKAGFSQLVLARELSLDEIREICDTINIPVETFVHGALCTGYSGRCQAGFAAAARSGNRGECPQICRLPFTLRDRKGKILAEEKYLLSLKDFMAIKRLENLMEAGVSSFKIEGRLKDMDYVKNVVAAYSQRLDTLIAKSGERYRRSSFGHVDLRFTPNLNKSFNRGYTTYRLTGSIDPKGISSPETPKSRGELILDVKELKPGDGISWINARGEYEGTIVNAINGSTVFGNRPFILPKGVEIRRTSDIQWKKLMASPTSERKLALDIQLDEKGVSAKDETDTMIRIANEIPSQLASKPQDYKKIFSKLGGTPFTLNGFESNVDHLFFPASSMTKLRRKVIDFLLNAKKSSYPLEMRRGEKKGYNYPSKKLISSDNVSNRLAKRFYRDHGVEEMEPSLEIQGKGASKGKIVMTSKHCILREIGQCRREGGRSGESLTIENGNLRFAIETDCKRCEMHLRML